MNISREELDALKVRAVENQFAAWNPGKRDWDGVAPVEVVRLIADLERARELLQAFVRAYEKATPATEYDVVEANAYSEAAAYLIDAGVE